MTWITRATLRRGSPARAALASLLVDASGRDVGHRLVWTLFADDPNAERDFLYREAEAGRYFIVSQRPPSDPQGLWESDTKPYAPAFRAGLRLGFSLRANPTRWVKTALKPTGSRVDVVMHAKTAWRKAKPSETFGPDEAEAAALAWLYDREDRLGVRFDRAFCAGAGYRQIKIARKSQDPIRFSVVDYEGAFEIVDPDALTKAAFEGVGKAKAHGCGLLLTRSIGA